MREKLDLWFGRGRVENYVLMALLIGLVLGAGGFWFGVLCSPYPMWIGFGLSFVLACMASSRTAIGFILLTAVCLLMTAFTFSYTGTDAMACYAPMQRLIIEGWNPIFDSTFEKLVDFAGNGCAVDHIICVPKISAYVGAFVAKSAGLFLADAFLGYVLIWVLFRASMRYCAIEFVCSEFAAFAFAMFVTFSPKVTSFLAGQVDYTAYATFAISLFSMMTWTKSRASEDLLTGSIGLLFALMSKYTMLGCGLLLGVCLLGWQWRRADLRRALKCVAVLFLLIGASPFITSWIHYGSPFYPGSSFNPNVPVMDLTSDFRGNAHALMMGYGTRILYAWISQGLACSIASWWNGIDSFSPVFTVIGGVGGLGSVFRMVVCVAVLLLPFIKSRRIVFLALFVFVAANLAPLKYIGYSRYFPQIWLFPAVAFYGAVFCPRYNLRRVGRIIQMVLPVIFVVLTVPVLVRTGAYQVRSLIIEGHRQKSYELCRNAGNSLFSKNSVCEYLVKSRARVAGIQGVPASHAVEVDIGMIPADYIVSYENLNGKYPICGSVSSLINFPWMDVVAYMPLPIFDRQQRSVR